MASLIRTLPDGLQGTKAPEIRHYLEAASQTFRTGDLVNLSSGKVQLIVAAGNNLTTEKILGMALQDATGTTDTDIAVAVFTPDTVLRLPVYHATAASAITATAGNGTAYELRNHTGSIWCVDIGSTTNTKLRQMDVAPVYPVGEQYGLVDVKFLSAQLLGAGV